MIRYIKLYKNSFFNRFMQVALTLLFVMLASSRLAFAGLPAQTNKVLALNREQHQYMHVINVDYGQINDYSIELWAKWTDDAGKQNMFTAKEDGTEDQGIIFERNDGNLRFLHRPGWGDSGGHDAKYDYDFNDHQGEWHHFAATVDITGGTDTIRLYIDGGEVKKQDFNNDALNEVTMDFYIGRLKSGDRHFGGQIDEVRFWGRKLSQSDIKNRRHQTLIGNETNLLGYWNFDTDLDSDGDVPDLQLNSGYERGDLKNGASIQTVNDLTFARSVLDNILLSVNSPSISNVNSAINISVDDDVEIKLNVTVSPPVSSIPNIYWTDPLTNLAADPGDDEFTADDDTFKY